MDASVMSEQFVQDWGNGLGVRITAPLARAAKLVRGMPIRLEVVEDGVFMRVLGKPRLTLAQKLKAFDPVVHGGEISLAEASTRLRRR